MVVLDETAEKETVSAPAPKSIVLLETIPPNTRPVVVVAAVDLGVSNCAGEEQDIRSSITATTGVDDTSGEAQGVITCVTSNHVAGQRAQPKLTESLPAPPPMVEFVSRSDVVTTKVSLPSAPVIEDAVDPTVRVSSRWKRRSQQLRRTAIR